MKIGLVGKPNVGKSTFFSAATLAKVDIANYPFCTIDPNVGVVGVPDNRLTKLAKISNSKKGKSIFIFSKIPLKKNNVGMSIACLLRQN